MRSILPVDVFGNGSVTISIFEGISVRASRSAQCFRSVRLFSLLSGSATQHRVQAVAGQLVRHGHHGDLDHLGVLLDRLLDDLRADPDPADLDVEVGAALERERAVVVAADDVAGAVVGRLAVAGLGMRGELALVELRVQIAARLERGRDQQLAGARSPRGTRRPRSGSGCSPRAAAGRAGRSSGRRRRPGPRTRGSGCRWSPCSRRC